MSAEMQKKVNDTDEIFSADLSIREKAIEAVKGSEIAYFNPSSGS
ncbi:NAD-dependent epimerase/dehydratase [Chryseobacterium sp. StRB126]|nr:NAD-dependent epimerase/dehydratase [Chryseobacterium sp. StRB126]